MLTAIHAMMFAEDPDKVRAFFRDVLKLEHVDAGGGWLIFALPPAELGVHPLEDGAKPHHRLYFMCDDVHKTMDEFTRKGVEFTMELNSPRPGIRICFIRGPEGVSIEVLERSKG